MPVDIGVEAIDRSSTYLPERTIINKDNPASDRGEITSIDIWAYADITGLRVGTFYTINGNTLKCRASVVIDGTITAGGKRTKLVSIAVEVGDYIGFYSSTGQIERSTTGYVKFWWITGEYIDPGDEAIYGGFTGDAVSLGGYIEVAPAVGRSFGFIIG